MWSVHTSVCAFLSIQIKRNRVVFGLSFGLLGFLFWVLENGNANLDDKSSFRKQYLEIGRSFFPRSFWLSFEYRGLRMMETIT